MKDDRIIQAKVRAALDDCLSGVDDMPSLRYDIMRKVRGEAVVKKKLSVGLIFAIVLILIALGAVAAALLSGKEFVEQELVPKVSESTSEKWTQEELDEILRIAAENGIVLSEDVLNRLQNGDGTYKEELMRIFVKVDLGFYPATWPIEEQAWYEKLLMECGLLDQQTRFIPEGDEISQEKALQVAKNYIRDVYQDDTDITDTENYLRYVEYRAFVESDGTVHPRKWYIRYESRDLFHNSYNLTILTDGGVEDASCEKGFDTEGGASLSPSEIRDRYETVYGGVYEWTMEAWINFQRDVTPAVDAFGVPSPFYECVLQQKYMNPDEGVIPKETAIDTAISAILVARDMTGKALEDQSQVIAILLLDEETPVWKVTVTEWNYGKDLHITTLMEIDAITAEVRNSYTKKNGIDPWYAPYVLLRLQPGPESMTPEAGVLPQRFLDMVEWAQSDMKDWTLEEKAQYSSASVEAGSIKSIVYGMPATDDLSETEAISISKDFLVDRGAYTVGRAERCATSTWFDIGDPNHPVWLVVLWLDDDPLDTYFVFIDARTQDILDFWTPRESVG